MDNFLVILTGLTLLGGMVFMIWELFRIPTCPKCGSHLVRGGWYSEHLFCSNPDCKRYQEWSYE